MEDDINLTHNCLLISELELHSPCVTLISCMIAKDIMQMITESCNAWMQRQYFRKYMKSKTMVQEIKRKRKY